MEPRNQSRTRMQPTSESFITQDQYDILLEKLSGIEAAQKEIAKTQETINLRLATREHIDARVKEIDKTLAGNGKWGFAKLRDWAMGKDEDDKYYRRFVTTMFITNLISLAATAFFWFARILPVLDSLQKAGS